MKAYCGYLKDESVLMKSSSGGIATAMSMKVLSECGIVYGAAYTHNFKGVEYIRVDNEKDLKRLQSSKYSKAKFTREILSQIADDLSQHKKVLFCGIPCDVNVVKHYMKKNNVDTSTLLTADLICHGAVDARVLEQYVDYLEKKYKSKVVEFSTRYKNPDWSHPFMYAKFENGKVVLKSFHFKTEYGLCLPYMKTKRCYNCPFKGEEGHVADITIGDYWGSTPEDAGYNKLGTSIIFVYDKTGEDFLHSLDDFNLFEADKEKALKGNPFFSCSAPHVDKIEWYRENFEKEGLIKTERKHAGLKGFIKRNIPLSLHTLVRKVLKGV